MSGRIISKGISVTSVYDGQDGAPGENSIRIDLSNQADMIACDADGKVRFNRTISTIAKIYDGAAVAPAVDSVTNPVLNVTRGGSTVNVASRGAYSSGMVIEFAFQAGDILPSVSPSVDITITYHGVNYTATFSLTRTDSTAIYQLLPSMLEIPFSVDSSNVYQPEYQRIDCGYTKAEANNTQSFPGNVKNNTYKPTAPYNILFRYQNADRTYTHGWQWMKDQPDGGSGDRYIQVGRDTAYIAIEFILTSANSGGDVDDSNIIDRETVPIIKSGKKGDTGAKGDKGDKGDNGKYYRSEYARGDSRTSHASGHIDTSIGTQGWQSTAPVTTQQWKFIWQRTILYNPATGSDEGDWTYVCLTGANGSDGQPGATGKWYEYAGVWGVDVSSVTNTDVLGKYVKYSDNFYMNIYTDGQANTTTPGTDNTKWSQMNGDREYYMAKAFFGDYAEFGSFIINGDWQISQNGGTISLCKNVTISSTSSAYSSRTILKSITTKSAGLHTITFDVTKSASNTVYVNIYNSSGTSLASTTISGTATSGTLSVTLEANKTYSVRAYKSSSSVTDKVSATISTPHDYLYFVSTDPTGESDLHFAPQYAVDGLTGKTYQNNAVVRGDVQAMTVISSNDQMETVIEAGSVEIRSKSTMSYGVFRINSNGEVVLSMYDKNGNKVIDLGGTPETQINGEWIVWVLRARDRGHNTDGKTYYATTESQCTTYYQLQLGQVINSGNTLEYFLPPIDGATEGVQTTDSNVISRNSNVFTSRATGASKTALETAIKALTYITDGYYVKPNDGRFEVEANQYGPTNYKIDMYHFYTENGVHKMEIVTERFSL